MLRPAYRFSCGPHTFGNTAEPRVPPPVALTVTLDADSPVGSAELRLGQVGGVAPAPGDTVTVGLGYADDPPPVTVFTGAVAQVEPGVTTSRVVAHDAAAPLLRAFTDRAFLNTSAGGIVRDLAAQAGVATGAVADGIGLPQYVVDSRRPLLAHIRDLAGLCGFDSSADADGRLRFGSPTGTGATHRLRYGKDVLGLRLTRRAPAAARVRAWGESPGASRGDGSWAWLTKDFTPYLGEAGSGEPLLLLQHSALRTRAAAETAATALLDRLAREAVSGTVRIPGDASVRPGDLVALDGTPRDDGTYRVRAVVHRLSKEEGFTTALSITADSGREGGA